MLIQVLITVAVAMSIAQLQLCLTQGGVQPGSGALFSPG